MCPSVATYAPAVSPDRPPTLRPGADQSDQMIITSVMLARGKGPFVRAQRLHAPALAYGANRGSLPSRHPEQPTRS